MCLTDTWDKVLWDRIFEVRPVDIRRILGIKLLAEMQDTITIVIVALTVRVVFVFAFVFVYPVAFGFAAR